MLLGIANIVNKINWLIDWLIITSNRLIKATSIILQLYQLSRDGKPTQLIKTETFNSEHKACRIDLLTNEKSADMKIKSSKLSIAKSKLIATWGKTDGNLFVSFCCCIEHWYV